MKKYFCQYLPVEGEKQKDLAKEFKIANGTINRIILKKSYSHL